MTIAKIKTLRKNFDMKKQKLISTRKKKKKKRLQGVELQQTVKLHKFK